MYQMYHEELESLAKFIPELERADLDDLWRCLYQPPDGAEECRDDRIDRCFRARNIVPFSFLAVLPKPETLGPTTKGKTNIGDIATGEALDGSSGEKTFYIYNICDHEDAFAETGNQAISYTTGVPAMIGAAMMLTGRGSGRGVQHGAMDPDPFTDMLNTQGLPWVKEMAGPVEF